METTIGQRFEALIQALKMNNNSFAVSIGKTPSMIKFIIDSKSKPGWEVIEEIGKKYPQVNSNWLLRGEGEMFIKEQEAQAPDAKLWERIVDRYENTIEDLRYTISLQRKLMGKLNPAPIRPSAGNVVKIFPIFEEEKIMAIEA